MSVCGASILLFVLSFLLDGPELVEGYCVKRPSPASSSRNRWKKKGNNSFFLPFGKLRDRFAFQCIFSESIKHEIISLHFHFTSSGIICFSSYGYAYGGYKDYRL